jgi:adenine-specific DNA methylase
MVLTKKQISLPNLLKTMDLKENSEGPIFPSTRFAGSKAKIVNKIWDCTEDLCYDTVLDAFGGTGCFSYISKKKGKETYFNDILSFNYNVGLATIENSHTTIRQDELQECLIPHGDFAYQRFIENTFRGIYFNEEENRWLDIVTQNIQALSDPYKKALLLSALGQSCLTKRPYNLFHRSNLNMRLRNVKRSFCNKKLWDTSFEVLFRRFVDEYNNCVFSNGRKNVALGGLDVFNLPNDFDLVYLDPPYMSAKSRKSGVDYLAMYHFLEGMSGYYSWSERIDFSRKNLGMKPVLEISAWRKRSGIIELLDRLIAKFSGSIIVLSYRSDGYPSRRKIFNLIKKNRGQKPQVFSIPYKYALSKNLTSELVFVA